MSLDNRKRFHAGLAAEHCELLHRRRAAGVERSHQHLALGDVGHTLGDLGRRRRFARALQSDHHDDHRRRRIEIDRLRTRAQSLDQLVVNDFHDHLARGDRLDHFHADGALLDLLGKVARDIERHVGFEQSTPHLAQRRLDIGFRQRAAPGQLVQDAVEAFRKIVEHCCLFTSPRTPGEGENTISARGRIALSGGCLRPLGSVGG